MAEQYYRLLVDQRILPVLYSSMEAAVEQAGYLRAHGREAVVVDPAGGQTWPDAGRADGRHDRTPASGDIEYPLPGGVVTR